MGVSLTVIDPADCDGLEEILKTKGATLFFSEQITNPLTRIIDTERICQLCKQYNVISCIDTTFATPVNHKPIDYGADIVLHSGSKYLAGHNDVMCGALAGRRDLIDQVRKLQGVLGGIVDPHAAYLLLRGIKTLSLRVQQQNKTAEELARVLQKHPCIEKVHYPTVRYHRDYDVANRPGMFPCGFGGVISFEVKGDGNPWSQETFDATARFIDALNIPYIGPSLGGVESLVEQVRVVGYYDQPLEVRQRLSITNGLVRFACGIEDTQDVVNDVIQALEDVPLEMTVAQMRELQPTKPAGDDEEGNRAWMRKTIRDLPNLRAPITVSATTTSKEAIRLMQAHGIDQMPVVQPFPGRPTDLEVVAVLSLAAVSKTVLKDPSIINEPVMKFASPKFVVVEPNETLESVSNALSAYMDRTSGEMGVVIVAEDIGGKKLLRHVVSRIDVLAYETDALGI